MLRKPFPLFVLHTVIFAIFQVLIRVAGDEHINWLSIILGSVGYGLVMTVVITWANRERREERK